MEKYFFVGFVVYVGGWNMNLWYCFVYVVFYCVKKFCVKCCNMLFVWYMCILLVVFKWYVIVILSFLLFCLVMIRVKFVLGLILFIILNSLVLLSVSEWWLMFGLNFSGSMFILIKLVWWMCLKFLVIIVLMLVKCMFLVV